MERAGCKLQRMEAIMKTKTIFEPLRRSVFGVTDVMKR